MEIIVHVHIRYREKGFTMHMRPSNVLKKLRAGEVVHSFKLNYADPRIAETVALIGFDCIWVCQEHIGNDWSAIESQIWAAKCHDVDVVVRIARGPYSDYIIPLEMDATGIMVPHVMSFADAEHVVRTTRFQPIGRRPVDGGNADARFCNVPFTEYIKQANEQRFIIVQIEDPEPLDEIDEIAQLEGIDMLFFGPGDFSHSIGAPGDWQNPRIKEARKLVVETAKKHGKFAGTTADLTTIREYMDMGYQFLNTGADVLGINEYGKALKEGFDKICGR